MHHAASGPLFATVAQRLERDVTLEFAVLGSSSAGNTSVLRVTSGAQRTQILIDGGLSPRTVRGHLAVLGFDPSETAAVLFTHFDHDHAKNGWGKVAMSTGMRLFCSSSHVQAARARGYPDVAIAPFDARGAGFEFGALRIAPCETPHDDGSTVAFRIATDAGTLGFATDLGRVSRALTDFLRGAHVLAFESNYDPLMQKQSSRPQFLKDRIMGGRGHLSNAECLAAVREIAWPQPPERVVLLHLSRDCNCPKLVRALWEREEPDLAQRLEIARPFEPLEPLTIRCGQLQSPCSQDARCSAPTANDSSMTGARL